MSYARLDYPAESLAPFGRDKLLMEANNDIERTMRVNACAKEPWTVAFIEAMAPGECFWDVGACVGSYTLIAAARGLGAIAWEPTAENFATLVRNLTLNRMLDAVVALPLGLADQNAMIWQHRSDLRSGAASHVMTAGQRKRALHQQLVPLVRADTACELWGLPIPNAIKIDVDGFEAQVLAGAEEMLRQEQLHAMMIELQVRNDAALIAWLRERGWGITEQFPSRGGIYYARFARC